MKISNYFLKKIDGPQFENGHQEELHRHHITIMQPACLLQC